MSTEHVSITDPEIHEPKGITSALADSVYRADGVGSGSWVQPTKVGWWDYNDLTTASTPIPLTAAATWYDLTNDGAGTLTSTAYRPTGFGDIWDTSTNRFTFSDLSPGDMVDIRLDVEFTTSSANTAVDLALELGLGASPYDLLIISQKNYKTSGTYQEVVWFGFYIGDANTADNPGKVKAMADATGATVKVNGWYIRPVTRGV